MPPCRGGSHQQVVLPIRATRVCGVALRAPPLGATARPEALEEQFDRALRRSGRPRSHALQSLCQRACRL
eukprot:572000-Prymnesium_polylepis.1